LTLVASYSRVSFLLPNRATSPRPSRQLQRPVLLDITCLRFNWTPFQPLLPFRRLWLAPPRRSFFPPPAIILFLALSNPLFNFSTVYVPQRVSLYQSTSVFPWLSPRREVALVSPVRPFFFPSVLTSPFGLAHYLSPFFLFRSVPCLRRWPSGG